jgi:limonene-1,2-epoxide hydrolase
MDDATEGLSRRTLFAAGGLGALALAGLASAAEADTAAPAAGPEKANEKIVDDFIKTWSAKDFDADKVCATFLADDASVRMVEDKPPLVGPAAVAAGFKSFTTDGSRVKVKILQTFAKGPVVVNSRVDTLVAAGKPDQAFKVAGVFVVKNGKIKEWTDYLAG